MREPPQATEDPWASACRQAPLSGEPAPSVGVKHHLERHTGLVLPSGSVSRLVPEAIALPVGRVFATEEHLAMEGLTHSLKGYNPRPGLAT